MVPDGVPILSSQPRIVCVMTGEREDLGPWIDPFVPVAGPVHMDASCSGQIDGLGAWCT